MSNRSWFFAAGGQQQGPYPEPQFRDLIARGQVSVQTLVWCEGMAGWQKAGEVPGLMAGGGAPPMVPQGGAVMGAGGYGGGGSGSGALSIDLPTVVIPGILHPSGHRPDLRHSGALGRDGLLRWLFPEFNVPGRPNLAFTGQVGEIWYRDRRS